MFRLIVYCIVVCANLLPTYSLAVDLSEFSSILPQQDEERWLEVPWRTNLMQARVSAQSEDKPLFIWIMDGHVLGST